MHAATIGLDLAKDVFQVHGVTETGKVVFNSAIKRRDLLTFFARVPPVSSAWRPADRLITGRGSSSRSATR